jgi:hypothetical protein
MPDPIKGFRSADQNFFGSHARSAHVPPSGLESTTATCHPADRHRDATADAADPVPMTTTSNFLVMPTALFLRRSQNRCLYPVTAINPRYRFSRSRIADCRSSGVPNFSFHNSCHLDQLFAQSSRFSSRSARLLAPIGSIPAGANPEAPDQSCQRRSRR